MKLYLDEDRAPLIASLGRMRGLDIVSSSESGRNGLSDERVLLLAVLDDRCVVTQNFRDFTTLTIEAIERGSPHAGVIFVPGVVRRARVSVIVDALVRFDALYPDGLAPYSLVWLPL
jgi:predicted nuclease of predicted toxin-antitoxin system